MMDLLKNLPAALHIAGPVIYLLVVIAFIAAGVFATTWSYDTLRTIAHNRRNRRRWHKDIRIWKLIVAIALACFAIAILAPAYEKIPRLREDISVDR
jgi:H+/Cl- antiporter ClcA